MKENKMNATDKTVGTIKSCCVCENEYNIAPIEVIRTFNPKGDRFSVWRIACELDDAGCGRVVLGETKENVIFRWNNMETDAWGS